MASKVISDFNLGTTVAKMIKDAAAVGTPLLNQLIPTARQCTNGSGPTWNVRGIGFTARTHSEGAAFATPSAVADQRATLGMGLYDVTGSISDESLSRANLGNPDQLKSDALAREMRLAVKELLKKMEVDLHTGTGSDTIIGVRTAIDASSSYAGVTRGSAPYFESYVKDLGAPAATSLTRALVDDFNANAEQHANERASFVFGSLKAFNQAQGLYTPTLNMHAVPGQALEVNGIKYPNSIMFGQAPMIYTYDGYVTSGTAAPGASDWSEIYMVGADSMHLEFIPYQSKEQVIVEGLPLGIQILWDPTSAHATRFIARCQVQLVVDNPFKCSKLRYIKLV